MTSVVVISSEQSEPRNLSFVIPDCAASGKQVLSRVIRDPLLWIPAFAGVTIFTLGLLLIDFFPERESIIGLIMGLAELGVRVLGLTKIPGVSGARAAESTVHKAPDGIVTTKTEAVSIQPAQVTKALTEVTEEVLFEGPTTVTLPDGQQLQGTSRVVRGVRSSQ